MTMQRVQLDISSDIFDKVMFFLENLPKNLVTITKEPKSTPNSLGSMQKKLPSGFLHPIQIESYKDIATRDELYER